MADGFELDPKKADALLASEAKANRVAVGAVPPQQATAAIQEEDDGGPPAEGALDYGNSTAPSGNDEAISFSPAFDGFHLDAARAAATRDDAHSLNGIADRLTHDFTAPFIDSWKQVGEEAKHYYQESQKAIAGKAKPQGPLDYLIPKDEQALGSLLFSLGRGVAVSIPSVMAAAGAANVAAGGYGDIYAEHPPEGMTPEQARQQGRHDLLLSLMGIRSVEGTEGVRGAEPPPPRPGPAPRAPINWPEYPPEEQTPQLQLPAPEGPVRYTTAEEAANAAADQNLAHKDQFFVHERNEDGTYSVRPLGTQEPLAPEEPPPVGTDETADAAYQLHADAQTQTLTELEELVAQSRTQTRSPSIMRDAIQSLGDRSIYVDPNALVDHWREGGTELTELQPEVQAALENGTLVRIPIGVYLTQVSGTPAADALRPHVTFHEDLPTPDQVKQFGLHNQAALPPHIDDLIEGAQGEGELSQPGETPSVTPMDQGPGTALVPLGTGGPTPTDTAYATVPEATSDLVKPARAAVARAIQSHYLSPILKDGKALGMADATLKAYAAKLEGAQASAHEKMAQKLTRQASKEHGPRFKEKLLQTTALAEQGMFSRPDVTALSYMRYAQAPNGAPLDKPFKLDRATAEAMFGKDRIARLPQDIFAKPLKRRKGGAEGTEPMGSEIIRGQAGVNTRRLAKMLGPQLYGDMSKIAEVTIKEVFQNSFDAVTKAQQEGALKKGRIEITTNRTERRIRFLDNGTGMSPELLSGKFLQIAGSEKGENSAGGFGIAKMLFLYGNAELQVITVKDGKLSTLDTTGPGLFDALEDETKQPDIKVTDWADVPEKVRKFFPDGHGTLINIKTPQYYTNHKGQETEVPFPWSTNDLPALIYSPLLRDIKVIANGDEVAIGQNFPLKDYTQFVKIDETYYEARVFVSREAQRPGWDGNVHVLSNGLWQFSDKMYKNPLQGYGDLLPYTIYIDMRPKVRPEDGGYPFNFNRQEFTPSVKDQFKKILNHIQMVYGQKNLQSSAESYGVIHYLNRNPEREWALSAPVDITPKLPVSSKGLGRVLKEGDTITIEDGILYVNGEELPALSVAELAAAVPKSDDLIVPQESIKANQLMVHDRVKVKGGKSLTEYAQKKYGQKYFEYLNFIGQTLKTLRTFFAGMSEEYEDLDRWALGVSFDPKYHGVNIKVPFSGIFINPFPQQLDEPDEQATELLMTMIHEISHYQQRNHSSSFTNEFENLFAKILASKWFGWAPFQNDFIERYREYSPMVEQIRGLYKEYEIDTVGKGFEDGSYSAQTNGGHEGILASTDANRTGGGDSGLAQSGGTYQGPLFSERVPGRGESTGVDPELAAQMFGFASVDEMFSAIEKLEEAVTLSGFKNLKDYIKGMTKAQGLNEARREMGFDASPKGLLRMAHEAIGTPEVEDLLIAELSVIAGRPIDKEAVKRRSQELFLDNRLSDGRRPSRYVVAISNAAKRTEKALLKGDYVAAFQAKQQQVIAQFQLRESFNLQREYARTEKRWKRWARTPALKTIEQEWFNWVHFVLRTMGYPVARDPEELERALGGMSFEEFMNGKIARGVPVLYTDIPMFPSVMSVGDYLAVIAMLKSMIRQGQRERTATLNGEKIAFEHAMLEVKKNADRSLLDVDVQGLEASGLVSGLRRLRSSGTAISLRVPQMILFLDLGDLNGPLQQLLNRPMQEAQFTQVQMLKEAQRQIDALMDRMPKDWGKSLDRGMPQKWYYAGEWVVRNKGQLIRFALNLGNESNKGKLLEGFGIEDEADMWAFVQEHMLEHDWDFVQGVWDIYAGLWPLIEELYTDLVGVPPSPIPATTITTLRGRTLRGGYFPVVYNFPLARKAAKRTPAHVDMSNPFGQEYPSALPGNHFIDRRKKVAYPINLNINTIFGALHGQIHDLAFRKALVQAQHVIYNPTFQSAVTRVLGPAYLDAFEGWLRYAAHESLLDEGYANAVARFLRGIRVNTAVVAIGWKLSTAALHGVQAMFNSMAEVDQLGFLVAMKDLYFSGPGQTKEWVEFVWNRSKEIPIRLNTVDRDMATAFQTLAMKHGGLSIAKEYAFHIIGLGDMFTAMPTWLAAYRKFLPDYGPEVAASMADETVRLAHGSGSTVNLTTIQRGGLGPMGELGRFASMFTAVISHNFNRSWYQTKALMDLSGKGAGRGLLPGGLGGGGGRLPPPTPEGWDDPEWEDEWQGDRRDFGKILAWGVFVIVLGAWWYKQFKQWQGVEKYSGLHGYIPALLHNSVGGFTLMNHLIDQIEGDYDDALSGMFKTLIGTEKNPGDWFNFWNAVTGHPDKVSDKWVRQAVSTPGYFTGMSNDQFGMWAQSLTDLFNGKEHFDSLQEAAEEIVKGPKKHKKHHHGMRLGKMRLK